MLNQIKRCDYDGQIVECCDNFENRPKIMEAGKICRISFSAGLELNILAPLVIIATELELF